jgi:hypothetical protein
MLSMLELGLDLINWLRKLVTIEIIKNKMKRGLYG